MRKLQSTLPTATPRFPPTYHTFMPKVKRVTSKAHLFLPRRISEEEARAHYRKEKLGVPGPVDSWIAASAADGHNIDSECPLGPDEVRCILQMQHVEAPSDNPYFSDPDTFVLYLTVTGAVHVRGSRTAEVSHRRIVLDQYQGWSDSLEAPEWTRWASGQTTAFRQRKSSLADVVRNALWEDAMTPLIDALDAAHLRH